MKLLENKDIVHIFVAFAVVSVAAITATFILSIPCGIITACACIVLTVLLAVYLRRRGSALARLSADIDKMLHGDSSISLSKYDEGELSILYSELYKLTVTLREQSDRLRKEKVYLSDSIADISHQIKTPLTSINLIILLLAKPDITDERRTALIRELYELATRIDRLVAAILKISKLDAGTVSFRQEETSLAELLKTACEPLQIPLELRNVTLEIAAEGGFCGDLAWSCEALGNIVKNCMEHTPEGGKISIAAEESALFSEIVIKDNGCGIDEEDLPHIFERFYRGKKADSTSVGIGLALAQMIVVGQNGTIRAENNSGGGACFRIRFYKSVI